MSLRERISAAHERAASLGWDVYPIPPALGGGWGAAGHGVMTDAPTLDELMAWIERRTPELIAASAEGGSD